MKTAISIPDILFYAAESTANKLGMPRSQLYVTALKEFLRHHNPESVTAELDRIYKESNSDESENTFLQAGLDTLRKATKNDTW